MIIKLCKAKFMRRNLTDILHVAAYCYSVFGCDIGRRVLCCSITRMWLGVLVLFLQKLAFGTIFGWALIPIALIMKLFRIR